MPIRLFTDSSANLNRRVVSELELEVVPLTMTVNGRERTCFDPDADFDGAAFYDLMREKEDLKVQTSLINTAAFEAAFEPCLQAGDDVLYVGMSSGISGTYHAAELAAAELAQRYPSRQIEAVDTRAASLAEGLMAREAARLRDLGKTVKEIAAHVIRRRGYIRQYFMVDNLQYLRRGGRISGGAALLGNIINLKPILMGDPLGRIVLHKKVLGRKKALPALVALFDELAASPHAETVGIAHGDCEQDAFALRDSILSRHPGLDFMIECYEPGTGCHVGPGTVALFFMGKEDRTPAES